MNLTILSVSIGLTLLLGSSWYQRRQRRRRRALAEACREGLEIDINGNIDARSTFASMSANQYGAGQGPSEKKSRFLELMRICSEGPKTLDEIRFLFEEGIEPVVRPDGVVYVPCIENEHMYMEGEVDLVEDDLDLFVKRQLVKPGEVTESAD